MPKTHAVIIVRLLRPPAFHFRINVGSRDGVRGVVRYSAVLDVAGLAPAAQAPVRHTVTGREVVPSHEGLAEEGVFDDLEGAVARLQVAVAVWLHTPYDSDIVKGKI